MPAELVDVTFSEYRFSRFASAAVAFGCVVDAAVVCWCDIGLLGAVLEFELVLLLVTLELGLVVTIELESLEKLFVCAVGWSTGVGGTERVHRA